MAPAVRWHRHLYWPVGLGPESHPDHGQGPDAHHALQVSWPRPSGAVLGPSDQLVSPGVTLVAADVLGFVYCLALKYDFGQVFMNSTPVVS